MREKVITLKQINQLPFEWLRYKLGKPNQDFMEEAVKHLAGIEQSVLEQLARDCFSRRMKSGIYTGAAELVREIHKRGEQAYFATSSFQFLIKPLEDFFGIGESVASVLEFSGGKTTGRIAGGSFFGAKKKAAVEVWFGKRNIDPRDVRFYTDSYTDLPLLKYCGQPVAVNPDRFLAAEAKKQGWEIIRFKGTLGKEK
jgi:putative phosphoserine phosphatase/1-acylglycerol-3-phosphate O-acyltransferase